MKLILVHDDVLATLRKLGIPYAITEMPYSPESRGNSRRSFKHSNGSTDDEDSHASDTHIAIRGKQRKSNLDELVRAKKLETGQVLILHDNSGRPIGGFQATVVSPGNALHYKGSDYSMSELARIGMQSEGYRAKQFAGPKFWFTTEGQSVR